MIADSVIALLMHAQSSAASIRLTSKPCRHPHDTEVDQSTSKRKKVEETTSESRLRFIYVTLKDQFQDVNAIYEGNTASYEIKVDGGLTSGVEDDDGKVHCSVKVAFDDSTGANARVSVECPDEKLVKNVHSCIQNLVTTAAPIML